MGASSRGISRGHKGCNVDVIAGTWGGRCIGVVMVVVVEVVVVYKKHVPQPNIAFIRHLPYVFVGENYCRLVFFIC